MRKTLEVNANYLYKGQLLEMNYLQKMLNISYLKNCKCLQKKTGFIMIQFDQIWRASPTNQWNYFLIKIKKVSFKQYLRVHFISVPLLT